jgi:hypothetical protein
MSEFKGTKEDWFLTLSQKGATSNIEIKTENVLCVAYSKGDSNELIALCGTRKSEEAKANALLCCKAPKLLEFARLHLDLRDLTYEEFYKKHGISTLDVALIAEKLIRESTDISNL